MRRCVRECISDRDKFPDAGLIRELHLGSSRSVLRDLKVIETGRRGEGSHPINSLETKQGGGHNCMVVIQENIYIFTSLMNPDFRIHVYFLLKFR